MFNTCHHNLYINYNQEKPLVDGQNSLESIGNRESFKITSLFHDDKIASLMLVVYMDKLEKRECPGTVDSVKLFIIVGSSSAQVIILFVTVCVCYLKCKKSKTNEVVDENPDYGLDNFEDYSEVKDGNDYYFYAKAEDDIEITDENEYYE